MATLLKFFLGLDVLLPVYLVFDLFVPILRSRPKFPTIRFVGRLISAALPRTTTGSLLEASNHRLREARKRLGAATADMTAAELEREALSLEERTNTLREAGDDLEPTTPPNTEGARRR